MMIDPDSEQAQLIRAHLRKLLADPDPQTVQALTELVHGCLPHLPDEVLWTLQCWPQRKVPVKAAEPAGDGAAGKVAAPVDLGDLPRLAQEEQARRLHGMCLVCAWLIVGGALVFACVFLFLFLAYPGVLGIPGR